METVLCNNNWMAVSFHLGGDPLRILRLREDEKEDPVQGVTARDGQSVRSYDDGNDSRATTSGCGCEILQRAPILYAASASIFLSLDQERTMKESCLQGYIVYH